MKVLFMTNILSFYRVNFFNELGCKCDLTVSYEANKANDRDNKFYNFNNEKFKLIKLNKNLFKLFRILRDDYDVIVIGTYATPLSAFAILLLELMGKKFIINADGGFIRNDGRIKEGMKKFFISKANYWISTGNETNKYLEHYGADKNKIFTYPFTSLFKKDILKFPVDKDEKNSLRKKYDIPINKKIFIIVGRFYYIKGNDIVIENIRMNKYGDCQFYFISGGQLKNEYERIISENNIKNITLIDYLNRNELYDYMKLSDALIMPTRGDVWGLVINEAMAVGLPIICSNMCIAGTELLDKKYIFDINNQNELTNLILHFSNMSDGDLYKIGQRCIKTISDYTLENMADEHIKIFNIMK